MVLGAARTPNGYGYIMMLPCSLAPLKPLAPLLPWMMAREQERKSAKIYPPLMLPWLRRGVLWQRLDRLAID